MVVRGSTCVNIYASLYRCLAMHMLMMYFSECENHTLVRNTPSVALWVQERNENVTIEYVFEPLNVCAHEALLCKILEA